jgi:hypothetical protein
MQYLSTIRVQLQAAGSDAIGDCDSRFLLINLQAGKDIFEHRRRHDGSQYIGARSSELNNTLAGHNSVDSNPRFELVKTRQWICSGIRQ